MTLRQTIVAQFGKPEGVLGRVAGAIMARRPSNRQRNLWTVDLLDIGPEDRILEFGCGPGLALAAVAARAIRGRVVGIDHSEVMIAQALRRNREAVASGRMALIAGGLDRIGRLGAFDKVFSVNVIAFVADNPAYFATMLSALRSGGTIATTYMPRHRGATRDDALRMAEAIAGHMTAAGFVAIRTEELPLRPVPAISVLGARPMST